ncbi:CCA-adding enzyme [Trichinella spiralis]|uniref:CCA-adding enzyme n=1 Tax=Trichinella spiralis TaxID=6334 RepID=A0ABR3KPW4_TRISP
MPDEELLKDIEKLLRIAKAAETSAMNFANGDKYVETTEVLSSSKGEAELLSMKNAKKWMQIQSEDENQSITPEK